jgi:hypothetical protein
MSDEMILSARNSYAKKLWLTVRNTHGKNRLQVLLEIDGQEEILEDTWVPCLDSSEGVHLHSHQLTNLFKGRDQEILDLKKMVIEARQLMQKTSMIYSSAEANDFYEKTKDIK